MCAVKKKMKKKVKGMRILWKKATPAELGVVFLVVVISQLHRAVVKALRVGNAVSRVANFLVKSIQ